MARLIVKSPYIKCGRNANAGGYLKYIATRERVEIIPDDRPPTRKQEQLFNKLTKDFPDIKTLYEYEDYIAKPTKVSASAFITLALEENWNQVRNTGGYVKYIATRPRTERLGEHGLFGDEDGVVLDKAMEEMENYTGNVWTHIISLKREDAARLGFDNAAAWRNLIRAHRNDIAAAMKIPPNDFRWYAAFHDEGEHPHVHMMAWSAKLGQAYLSKDGIRQIKSTLTNHIFQNEMLRLYEQKSVSRDELVYEARKAMLEMVRTMKEGICDHPEAEQLMLELALQLETVKGKKPYGYLPKPQKKLVDRIVDEMERLPSVRKCYEQWLILQGKVDAYYHDKPQVLSSNSESNVVARSASSSAKNSGSRIELIAAVGHRYGHVCLQAFFVFHESIERTQTEKALLLQGFQKMRGPFFDKNVRKTDLVQAHQIRFSKIGFLWEKISHIFSASVIATEEVYWSLRATSELA